MDTDIYHNYAPFYDLFEGEQKQKIKFIKNIIQTYSPKANNILELACGTGTLMAGLSKSYSVEGLDVSPDMLKHAKEKNPGAVFYEQDMSSFRTEKTYDVIYCIYDSINHLVNYEQWESTFTSVHNHLNPKGIFIFDMNTQERLTVLSEQEPWFFSVDDHHIAVEIRRDNNASNIFYWNAKIFVPNKNDTYTMVEETIKEAVFTKDKVKNTLQKYFNILSVSRYEDIDNEDNTLSDEDKNLQNIYFVSQRK